MSSPQVVYHHHCYKGSESRNSPQIAITTTAQGDKHPQAYCYDAGRNSFRIRCPLYVSCCGVHNRGLTPYERTLQMRGLLCLLSQPEGRKISNELNYLFYLIHCHAEDSSCLLFIVRNVIHLWVSIGSLVVRQLTLKLFLRINPKLDNPFC